MISVEGRHPLVRPRPPPTARGGHTLHGGCASVHGVQRPISPQVLTKDKRPPSLCRQCTAVVFLGLTNTCCNRNGWGCTPSTPQKLHQVHPQEVAPQKLHPGVKARGAGGGRGVHPLYTSIQKLHPGTKAKGAGVGGCPLYTWVQKLHRILV